MHARWATNWGFDTTLGTGRGSARATAALPTSRCKASALLNVWTRGEACGAASGRCVAATATFTAAFGSKYATAPMSARHLLLLLFAFALHGEGLNFFFLLAFALHGEGLNFFFFLAFTLHGKPLYVTVLGLVPL